MKTKEINMKLISRFYSVLNNVIKPKICVIGSGPAGFYAAQYILKNLQNSEVDVIERLPVPFGLVRYGVAPDHQGDKNVINTTFNKIAANPRFQFVGNVNLGSDVSLQQLQDCYHAVMLAYGADSDRTLSIPGESLDNVWSAKRFVAWYNGAPEEASSRPDLRGRAAIVLGQGNVAVDVARILLKPIDELKKTDIAQHALNHLADSKIEEVYLVGRRGPLQAAYTAKELRGMTKLSDYFDIKWREDDFNDIDKYQQYIKKRKQKMQLTLESLKKQNELTESSGRKILRPVFYRTPLNISKSSVKFAVNILDEKEINDENDIFSMQTVSTNEVEFIRSDFVVRSIGYKAVQADPTIPFDDKRGITVNVGGKISDGLYSTGWLSRGPVGIIADTRIGSYDSAKALCQDLNSLGLLTHSKPGYDGLCALLKNKDLVNWKGWEKIDKYEIEEGNKVGKLREKVIDKNKMLEIAQS